MTLRARTRLLVERTTLAVLVSSYCSACQLLFGFESVSGKGQPSDSGEPTGSPERDAAPGDAGRDRSPGVDAGTCGHDGDLRTQLRGPDMVHVVAGARCVWIDRTEVTRGQYEQFVQAGPARAGGVCDFDATHEVDPQCLGADGGVALDDTPITCVDWCDAAAFCDWAGKRLCAGDYLLSTASASRGEWNFACSSNGSSVYPYGARYNAIACNGKDNPEHGCGGGDCALWPAGSATTCATPAGVHDLTGNAVEWTDECQSVLGADDECNTFGGDVNTADPDCADKVSRARSYTHRLLGFRCCAIAEPRPASDLGG